MKINKKFYNQNGYLVLNDALSKAQIIKLKLNANQMIGDFSKGIDRRQSTTNNRRKHKDISKNGKIFFGNQCEYYSHINSYAKGSFLKEIAKQILGKKIYLFNEQLVNKSPNTPSSFSWHQDSGYINHKHKPYVSIWLSLIETDKNNGALSLIPTNLKTIHKPKNHVWQENSKDLGISVNEKKAILCEVSSGSLVIFSSLTPHSSGPNYSNKARKAYLSQYSSVPIIDPFNGIQRNRAFLL
jgi:ectoine hydroxylase-related dioxygenase (phytanoyl-CoA dioxygenase family)